MPLDVTFEKFIYSQSKTSDSRTGTRLTCDDANAEAGWKNIDNLIISVVLGIIASMVTATTAGVALHTEAQAAEFVKDWHLHSYEFWTQQNKVDWEIGSR